MADWITTDHANLLSGTRAEAVFTLGYSRDRMLHALGQLSDEQVWWRPHLEMNAAGNVVLHVCGNLRQWVVVGAGRGGVGDERDRPSEFAARGGHGGDALAEMLRGAVGEAIAAIEKIDEAELLAARRVQMTEVTGLGAVWHSVAHLEGHAQEMIYLVRLQLGAAYRFKDVY
ncbi:MAG: DUF1572 family protein [Planctomycetota bacterium]